MIQPIETAYASVHFRSRLEARWALFFDLLGVPWEYEPEAFKLPSGECYLPDFWLPQLKLFAEVKPAGAELAELNPALELASMGRIVVSLYGPPWIYPWTMPTGPDAIGATPFGLPDRIAGPLKLVFSDTYGHVEAVRGHRRRASTAAMAVRSHRFWEPRRA